MEDATIAAEKNPENLKIKVKIRILISDVRSLPENLKPIPFRIDLAISQSIQ